MQEWLNSKAVKDLMGLCKKQWDCMPKLDYRFLKGKEDSIYIVGDEAARFDNTRLRVNSLGLYFGRLTHGEIRLSVEGSQIIGPLAKKNVIELDDAQFEAWLRGLDLELTGSTGAFLIIKHDGDYFGCGRHTEGKLLNLIPKERRIRAMD